MYLALFHLLLPEKNSSGPTCIHNVPGAPKGKLGYYKLLRIHTASPEGARWGVILVQVGLVLMIRAYKPPTTDQNFDKNNFRK